MGVAMITAFYEVSGIVPGQTSGVVSGPIVLEVSGHHVIRGSGWDSRVEVIGLPTPNEKATS